MNWMPGGGGFVRSAPPGRAALYDAKVDELRRRDRSDSSQTTQGVASRCGTGSSNPALSSRQSVSLQQPLLTVENPAFRARLGSWLADRVSRDSLGVSISRQPGQYLCRAIFHMWTALSSQGVLQYFDQIARVHMSGLFVRSHMNAGQDGLCDKSSKQNRDLIEGHWNMRISLVVHR